MRASTLLIAALLVSCVFADTYMHNMRGSNNRLNENNQNRNNANRLFDSQNNNQGGYNVGDDAAQDGTGGDGAGVMQYYETSILSLEWTNQHGLANPNMHVNYIIQAMCDDTTTGFTNTGLRDGTTTTAPNANNDADPATGRHETGAYFNDCAARERNKGLFTADQDLNGDTAEFTRQNTNGDQSGLECPEERDYYPYWHPTPWYDIAVLTDTPDLLCPLFQSESQNVKAKNYCSVNTANNQAACTAAGGQWLSQAAFNLAPPACEMAPWSRDNHLGNTIGGYNTGVNISMPSFLTNKICTMRYRYNITTGDIAIADYWNSGIINATLNGDDNSPLIDNPTVNFGNGSQAVSVKLALNTDQYGRTFQDRSHTFKVLPRPANIDSTANIYNLNVRGRRGNIVQTYPSVEYDFVPQAMVVGSTDYVHIQWTGSLSTPAGAGEGTESTDKSNIVQVADANHNYPLAFNSPLSTLFTSQADKENFATAGQGAGVQEQLNDASSYFNSAPLKPGGGVAGTYHFYSTRNNNFSNRSQKGMITVV